MSFFFWCYAYRIRKYQIRKYHVHVPDFPPKSTYNATGNLGHQNGFELKLFDYYWDISIDPNIAFDNGVSPDPRSVQTGLYALPQFQPNVPAFPLNASSDFPGACFMEGGLGMSMPQTHFPAVNTDTGYGFEVNQSNTANHLTNGSGTFLPMPSSAAATAPTVIHQAVITQPSYPCQHGCNRTFVRSADLNRHNCTVHHINRGTHICPIANCIKSHGPGYSRADKLKEHMWKQHADLGYVKGRA